MRSKFASGLGSQLLLILVIFILVFLAYQVQSMQSRLSAISAENAKQATVIANQAALLSHLATQRPNQEALSALATQSAGQATVISSQGTFISHLATRGPARVTPVAPGAEPTPYRPILGSVLIEDGICCAGGKAGETIEIEVGFVATSPFGEVTQMRVGLGGVRFTEEELSRVEWEPFVNQKSYPVQVALNWVGYAISVQYQDGAGNLSPVYADEIAVEGSP